MRIFICVAAILSMLTLSFGVSWACMPENQEDTLSAFQRADLIVKGHFTGAKRKVVRTFTVSISEKEPMANHSVTIHLYEFVVERVLAGKTAARLVEISIPSSNLSVFEQKVKSAPISERKVILPLLANAGALDEGYVMISNHELAATTPEEIAAAEALTFRALNRRFEASFPENERSAP